MKPFFLRDTTNFGDFANHVLWPRLIPELLQENDGIRLIGIGSLLKSDLNYVSGKKIIFGTGSGYGGFPAPTTIKDWTVYFVRGPLTADKFGFPPEKSIVDGAWLFSLLPSFNDRMPKKQICFIPHWRTAEKGNWKTICDIAGIKYINPLFDFDQIIYEIGRSNLAITESLHGAIFADLFRTPWIPIKISKNFLNFKWKDWCESINVPFNLIELPPSNFVDCMTEGKNPFYLDNELRFIRNFENERMKSNEMKTPPHIIMVI